MPALIARINKDEAEETARDILSKVGLQNRLNHRIGELSGGEAAGSHRQGLDYETPAAAC